MRGLLERTIRGGAGFLAANAVTRASGFLFVLIAGRLLGPAAFGVLSLSLTVAGLARTVAGFGLPDAIVRMLAGEGEDESERLLGAAVAAGGVFAILGAGALYLSAPALSDVLLGEGQMVGALRILAAGVVLWVPIDLGRSLLQARERVGRIVLLDLVQQVARLAAVAGVLLLVGGVEPAAAAVAASMAAPLVLVLVQVRSLDVRPVFDAIRSKLSPVTSLAAPLLVVGLSYTLARYADRIMLGALGTASQVGVYTVAATLASGTLVLHGALVSGFKPIVADAYRSGGLDEARPAYLLVSKWAAAASGLLLLIFAAFGQPLLTLFGADYATGAAHRALLLLTGLFFVGTWLGPTGAVLQMSSGERAELVNTTVFMTVNVALNLLLIPRYGIVGAAVATATSGLVRNGMQVWELSAEYSFVPVDARGGKFLLGVLVATAVVLALPRSAALRSGAVAVGLVASGWHLWSTMTEAERGYLERVRSRLLSS